MTSGASGLGDHARFLARFIGLTALGKVIAGLAIVAILGHGQVVASADHAPLGDHA